MKAVSGKRFMRLLERHGWELQRVSGSHRIFAKSGSVARISVPVHGSKPLKIGLQRHFMKVASISENEL
jgi:predicted RNA binding protein YcfA (HicA-like mRNA interferase family)